LHDIKETKKRDILTKVLTKNVEAFLIQKYFNKFRSLTDWNDEF